MEGSDGSPPQSLCMIRAAELFPKLQMEKEDTELSVPFQELAGESVKYLGRTDDGIFALTNYRIFLLKNSTKSETSVPLSLIEIVHTRDLFHLIISCKDASTVKCSFETAEQCSEASRRIQLSIGVPETLETLFAFPFCSWICDGLTPCGTNNFSQNGGALTGLENGPPHLRPSSSVCSATDYSERLQRTSHYEDDFFMREVERLAFDLKAPWRITHANKDFKLCASYPQKILVPSCISDDFLHKVANFRGSRRLPAVVWRHRKSGAIIARCSQPEVGWLGWRNAEDEKLLKAIADACAFDRGEQMRRHPQMSLEQGTQSFTATSSAATSMSDKSTPSSPDSSHEEVPLDEVRKVLIVDARSYTSAVTNRARGGGCECIEYYPFAEIEFMNLGNIHAIRKSFHALRQLCASPPDLPNWLTMLEKTMWLQHLSGLLAASMTVCHAVEKKGRPVLVHCSDGWDRTPQLVATAQLCLDPYYRTVEGFRVLVEREWLSFGHKFADRCGHGPGSDELNERCPVFLQWLDLVHQIHKQFPCSFEFSIGYLIKLAQHSHSCLFGTFLCNTLKERIENSVFERTFSVWPFLSGPMYKNPLYLPNRETVLWPAHNVRDLELWTEVYLGSLGNQNCVEMSNCSVADNSLNGSMSPVVKTRSFGDLITASIIQNGISRRSSDPNMAVDSNLTMSSNSENTSVADIQSEREDSPDVIASLFHDTTRNIENLTIELNTQDDNEDYLLSTNNKTTTDTDERNMKAEAEHQHCPQSNVNHASIEHQLLKEEIETYSNSSPIPLALSTQSGCETEKLLNLNPKPKEKPADDANSSVDFLEQNGSAYTRNTKIDLLANCSENNEREAGTAFDSVSRCSEELVMNASGIRIHKTGDINLDMMQSVDLSDIEPYYATKIASASNLLDTEKDHNGENFWHGSVNTSTDTLVPVESNNSILNFEEQQQKTTENESAYCKNFDYTDGVDVGSVKTKIPEATILPEFLKENRKSNVNGISLSSILPKVHNNNSRPNAFSNVSSSDASSASLTSSSSLKNLHVANFSDSDTTTETIDNLNGRSKRESCNNQMEESILILPAHQKLDISLSGKYETIPNNVANATTQTIVTDPAMTVTTNIVQPNSAPASSYDHTQPYFPRRRRTSSSNSRRDGFVTKQIFGNSNTMQRLPNATSIAGIRSLPMTPPALVPDRPQIAISCPDGLAHALSEQNIRLQQIVHEHKLREDALLREIHDMRIALLKKKCPNCNNAPTSNDEQCSVLDNVENVSVCSWEAVEDRSGPSSCTSSSIQPNNSASVLWVPDHAVSRCTSCQTEFWLGRRKHHCRSCGQIFCADCSEFWAPLPDEKLFNPVRLCGPCYHAVTTRMQLSQSQIKPSQLLQAQPLTTDRNKTSDHTGEIIPPTPTSVAVVSVTNATLLQA